MSNKINRMFSLAVFYGCALNVILILIAGATGVLNIDALLGWGLATSLAWEVVPSLSDEDKMRGL